MPGFNFSNYFSGAGSSGGSSGSGSSGTGGATALAASLWLAGIGVPNITTAADVSTYTDPNTGNDITLEDGAAYLDLATGTPYFFNNTNDAWDVGAAFGGGGLLFDAVNPTPSDGYDGATWINTATGSVFERAGGVWSQSASLVGPAGPVGPANGREFRSFSGVPTDGVGQDGDTGLDRLTGDLYTKSSGTWSATGQNLTGPQGADGKSAYQVWLDQGNVGLAADFIASLKGEKGDPGSPGGFSFRTGNGAPNDATGLIGDAYADRDNRGLVYVKADDGQGGSGTWVPTADYIGANQMIAVSGVPTSGVGLVGDYAFDIDNGGQLYYKQTATIWVDLGRKLGPKGDPGKSVYELAVDGGYTGTQAEYLASLKGDAGRSAYDEAIANGFVGTESEWLDSIIGAPGESAYETHVRVVTAAGGTPYATELEWLNSLEGPQGPAGNATETAFDTIADLEAATVPGGVDLLTVGAEFFRRVAYNVANVTHIQSTDGAGWEPIAPAVIDLAHPIWGVVGDGVTDDSAALQAVINRMEAICGTSAFSNKRPGVIRFHSLCYIGTGLVSEADNLFFEGVGHHSAGLTSDVAGIKLLTIGDPTFGGGNPNPVYGGGLRNMSLIMTGAAAADSASKCVECFDWLFATIKENLFDDAYELFTGHRLNSSEVSYNMFRFSQRDSATKALHMLALLGRTTDGKTAGSNRIIGNLSFSPQDSVMSDGTSACQFGFDIGSVDWVVLSKNHIYFCDHPLRVFGDGTNARGYIDALDAEGNYWDSSAKDCVRYQGRFNHFKAVKHRGDTMRDGKDAGVRLMPDNGSGVYVDWGSITLESCDIRRNGQKGVVCDESAGRIEVLKILDGTCIENNEVANDANGGDLDVSAKRVLLRGNTLIDGGASGFAVRIQGNCEAGDVEDNDMLSSAASQYIVNNALNKTAMNITGNRRPFAAGKGISMEEDGGIIDVAVAGDTIVRNLKMGDNETLDVELDGVFQPADDTASTTRRLRALFKREGGTVTAQQVMNVIAAIGADSGTAGWGIAATVNGLSVDCVLSTPGTTNSGAAGGRWVWSVRARRMARS